MIGGSFARSKFALDKLAIPPDLVQAYFDEHSASKGARSAIAKDANGNKLYSAANPASLPGLMRRWKCSSTNTPARRTS